MVPAQKFQLSLNKRLRPDGKPIDPCFAQLTQQVHIHLAGIHLDGELPLSRAPLHRVANYPKQLFLWKTARTSAADVDSFYLVAQLVLLQFGNHRPDNSANVILGDSLGVEAAVAALGAAEGNVNV
jgi:hypothetical protein